LTSAFTESGGNIKELLRLIFSSEDFYAPEVVRAQVKSPVQWLVAACRQLDLPLPPPLLSARITASLGQDLFVPPSVKGWDEGLAWISTSHLQRRYRLAAPLVNGQRKSLRELLLQAPDTMRNAEAGPPETKMPGVKVTALFRPDELAHAEKLLAAVEQLLLQDRLEGDSAKALADYVADLVIVGEEIVRDLITRGMMTREYQLC
jgi:hypothetical protein